MSVLLINGEECRIVPGFERYHVSPSARIYRTTALNAKEKNYLDKGAIFVAENQIHNRLYKGSYRQGTFGLTNANGKLFNILASVVVAKSFGIVSPDFNRKKNVVSYIDGNKHNLHYTNLREDAFKHGNGKLTKSDVRKIKKQIAEGVTLKDIANEYGVSDMQINRIKTGENWGNGKRKIQAPKAPFPIADGMVRKYIAIFDQKPVDGSIRKLFKIKRNPKEPTDNLIFGIVNGYKLSLKHKNITRARVNVEWLNDYFFETPQ